MSKIKCEIREIIGELSEVNSRNNQKVVAIASWNDREDTVNIRQYNTVDEILLNGISLTFEEAENLIYILLSSRQIEYDENKVKKILNERSGETVDIEKLVDELEDEDESSYLRGETGGIVIHER